MNWWQITALFLFGVVFSIVALFVWALMLAAKRADQAAEAWAESADGIDPAGQPVLFLLVNNERADLDAEAAELYRQWLEDNDPNK